MAAMVKSPLRPLGCWKSILRQSRHQKLTQRYLSTALQQPSKGSTPPPPRQLAGATFISKPFYNPHYLHAHAKSKSALVYHLLTPRHVAPKKIKTYPPPPTPLATYKDPIAAVTTSQLTFLDPTGARTKLFARSNPDAAKVGDILLVRLKNNSDTFAGVCLNIRRRGVDTGILLRNQLTRVGVEMWFKVYSPNVEGVEVVQRRAKRARRARLYYMRKPKHDMGSVQNIVQQYLRMRAVLRSGDVKGRDANAGKKKKNKNTR
ncbi:MAG: hypothetical protein M1830_000933 [Pleopsidium flavum]|nr:MAG: hypothetical protein M1830_000933 [Pleopsidium flavum]